MLHQVKKNDDKNRKVKITLSFLYGTLQDIYSIINPHDREIKNINNNILKLDEKIELYKQELSQDDETINTNFNCLINDINSLREDINKINRNINVLSYQINKPSKFKILINKLKKQWERTS